MCVGALDLDAPVRFAVQCHDEIDFATFPIAEIVKGEVLARRVSLVLAALEQRAEFDPGTAQIAGDTRLSEQGYGVTEQRHVSGRLVACHGEHSSTRRSLWAYANIVVLDKRWPAQVEKLKLPARFMRPLKESTVDESSKVLSNLARRCVTESAGPEHDSWGIWCVVRRGYFEPL